MRELEDADMFDEEEEEDGGEEGGDGESPTGGAAEMKEQGDGVSRRPVKAGGAADGAASKALEEATALLDINRREVSPSVCMHVACALADTFCLQMNEGEADVDSILEGSGRARGGGGGAAPGPQ
jgi:hypothetical protein